MKPIALERLDEFSERRVFVVGDLMLDEFVHGDVKRISPEAPVPVLEVKRRSNVLGGAANAANNVKSLGGHVALAGVVGDDAVGQVLRQLAVDAGLDAQSICTDSQRPTTQKTRIVARGQQVVRIDNETRAPLSASAAKSLEDAAVAAVEKADACIVSDYGKGVVTAKLVAAIVAAAKRRKCPIVVDPKQQDFSIYRGASVVTPNLGELEVAAGSPCAGTEDVVRAATRLLPLLDGGAVLVTRGAAGMTLVDADKPPVHTHARARTVFDVTGAGDTVVGTLALALACGIPLTDAMEIASVAAGLVVSKMGTATVTTDELRSAIEEQRGTE